MLIHQLRGDVLNSRVAGEGVFERQSNFFQAIFVVVIYMICCCYYFKRLSPGRHATLAHLEPSGKKRVYVSD